MLLSKRAEAWPSQSRSPAWARPGSGAGRCASLEPEAPKATVAWSSSTMLHHGPPTGPLVPLHCESPRPWCPHRHSALVCSLSCPLQLRQLVTSAQPRACSFPSSSVLGLESQVLAIYIPGTRACVGLKSASGPQLCGFKRHPSLRSP